MAKCTFKRTGMKRNKTTQQHTDTLLSQTRARRPAKSKTREWVSKQINKQTKKRKIDRDKKLTNKNSEQQAFMQNYLESSKNHIYMQYIRFEYIHPLFMNVKRQQCLSVSKHNSKQHIFHKEKNAIKTTVRHTISFFSRCCWVSVTFTILRVFVYVHAFFFRLCYLFIFGVSFLFVICHFHFFFHSYSVPNRLFLSTAGWWYFANEQKSNP